MIFAFEKSISGCADMNFFSMSCLAISSLEGSPSAFWRWSNYGAQVQYIERPALQPSSQDNCEAGEARKGAGAWPLHERAHLLRGGTARQQLGQARVAQAPQLRGPSPPRMELLPAASTSPAQSYVRISPLPLTAVRPRSRHGSLGSRCCVASLTWMEPGAQLPSMRLAVFCASGAGSQGVGRAMGGGQTRSPSVSMSLPLHSRMPRVAQKTTIMGRRSLNVTAQSAAAPAPAPAKPAFKWGANMKDLSICVGVATLIWFIPPPAGVTLKAWHLLSVFIGTIVGIITTPLPLGAVAVLGLGAAMLTKVLTFAEAFSAFASEIPIFWPHGSSPPEGTYHLCAELGAGAAAAADQLPLTVYGVADGAAAGLFRTGVKALTVGELRAAAGAPCGPGHPGHVLSAKLAAPVAEAEVGVVA
ncbi:Dicarboxylate transporter 1, chloroplastic [Tetrabaena socialis]|uniref:Dicarboxylate transporter 1, chloroplastic n=1 Tax=Tetrabaena socialis TaxID=47790 RepID=A0A2J7ZNY8_9CHLO|nr:Dicarboxylate transporter 1, chloroplastic [Tetrabaena socialis]|eukprot:PNH01976.1 Dicarboxylate transporter 1, chloroplastic [Tetrabaena socialis]